jgi:hypothetical protein
MSTFNMQQQELDDGKNYRITHRLKNKQRHEEITALAKKNKRSLNEEINTAIDFYIDSQRGREILNRLNPNK